MFFILFWALTVEFTGQSMGQAKKTKTSLPVFIHNILNCVPKTNTAFYLERHGGKWLFAVVVQGVTNWALTSLAPQQWESPDNMRQAALIPQIVFLYRLDIHITVLCLSWHTEFVWLKEPEASSKSNPMSGFMTCKKLQDWTDSWVIWEKYVLKCLSTESVFWVSKITEQPLICCVL